MGKVSFNISMSLDGYINGPDVTPEQGWAGAAAVARVGLQRQRAQPRGARLRTASARTSPGGARTTSPSRGGERMGPTGELRVPVFVVTHSAPDDVPDGGVYTFVTGGIEDALEQAEAAAGDKGVA